MNGRSDPHPGQMWEYHFLTAQKAAEEAMEAEYQEEDGEEFVFDDEDEEDEFDEIE